MTGRYEALRQRAFLVVAFLRQPLGIGYRVVLLAGGGRQGRHLATEVQQGGAFEPVHTTHICGRTVSVRTPPVFIMRGWLT